MNNKQVMVSGIQPTNDITLGNYLGAIRNFIKYQDEYKMYIFVADLHAITNNSNIDLIDNRINLIKTMLACGLDSNKVIFFNQSDVLEHTLLGYIMMCNTTIGELNRMTQFKDKSQKCKQNNGTEYIPTGLLIYPALMAADILLYDANIVIVGQDQKQHLELTRNIAQRINEKYHKQIFTIPEFKTEKITTKIMDLQNPLIKMSKSNVNHKGTIFINDDIEITRKKIMQALTDNFNQVKFDEINQPGISNLINIYCALTNKTIQETEQEFKDIENYGQFKKAVADVVCTTIKNIQKKINNFSIDQINNIMQNGANLARDKAHNKLLNILKDIKFK